MVKANYMENEFTRADIAALLSEVAAEYTAKGGPPLSVVIHGGASAVLRHDFRKTTHDIDYALPEQSPLFADCVASVGQRHGFFPRWMHPMPQFSETPRYRENLRRHVEPLAGFLTGTDGTVSFSAQDDAWLLVHSFYFFRRYKRDAENILGILQEERTRGRFLSMEELRRTIREVYGGDVRCSWEGEALLPALGPDADLSSLLALHKRRTEYYKGLYGFLYGFLRLKCSGSGDDAEKIVLWESVSWQTETDIRNTLAEYGVSLSPQITGHIARQLFAPEYISLRPD